MVERLSFKQKFIVFGVGLLSLLLLGVYCYFVFSSREKIYHVNFRCSVNGLKEGSCVTYKGVEIGSVSAIRIELPDADVVKVSIRVKHYFPVYSNYSAALSSRGFTGYYTIDLNKEEGEQIEMPPGSFINYKPSPFEEILQNIPEMAKEANILFKNINACLTPIEFKKLADCVDIFSKNMITFSEDLTSISKNGNEEIIKILNSIGTVLNSVISTVNRISSDYDRFQSTVSSKMMCLSDLADEMSGRLTKKTEAKTGVWKFFN